jgi:purine-binding chemotaxis protein CheW
MAKSLRRKLREINLEGAYSSEENARLILDERTRNLAARRVAAAPTAMATPVLICVAGPERYGIPLADIAEILPAQTCVPIPDGPSALVGILGRRGRPVSVIDLAIALGMSATSSETVFDHFVLLRREQPRVALRVERAEGVVAATSLTPEDGQAFRNDAVIGYAEFRSGAADQEPVLSLLDVDRLIRSFLPTYPVSGV